MTPRPSKPIETVTTPPPQQGTPPKVEEGTQGHQFGLQFAFDVNKQLGRLEAGLDNIDKRLEKVETKLTRVEEGVAAITSKIDFIKPIAKNIGKGIWAIVLILLTFSLTMLGYWAKHHFGW